MSPRTTSPMPCKNDAVRLRDYRLEDRAAFEAFNRAWVEKYFAVEPIDAAIFADPQKAILDKGGRIFVAQIDGAPAGVCALKMIDAESYELSKMGVDDTHKGKGIAKLLTQHAVEAARRGNTKKIIIYSNRLLENALRIYRECGFTEIPLTEEDKKYYQRVNIKLELLL